MPRAPGVLSQHLAAVHLAQRVGQQFQAHAIRVAEGLADVEEQVVGPLAVPVLDDLGQREIQEQWPVLVEASIKPKLLDTIK